MTQLIKEGLFITVGPPGAGKSTWARQTLPWWCLRLERDRFRECLYGTRRTYHEHPHDRVAKSKVVTDSMMAALRAWPENCWAVTDTATRHDSVQPFIEAALFRMVPVTFVIFERTDEYLLDINRTRPEAERIPDEILLEMIAYYRAEDAWWRELQRMSSDEDPATSLFRFVSDADCC